MTRVFFWAFFTVFTLIPSVGPMFKTIDHYKVSMEEPRELKDRAELAIKYVETIAPYKIVVETPEFLKNISSDSKIIFGLHNERFAMSIFVIRHPVWSGTKYIKMSFFIPV